MRYLTYFLCIFIIGQEVLAKQCKPCPSWWNTGWAMTIFSGPLTSQTSSKILGNADFSDSGIIALAGAKRLGSIFKNQLDFELEAQAVQHFGKQKHFELNPIILVARWTNFPWNNALPTTLAIGDGLSIATETPKVELKRRGHKDCGKVLNFVMAELTLSLPEYPQWALVARYHHRSGMFGTFHGVHDASTAFAAGFKYWF